MKLVLIKIFCSEMLDLSIEELQRTIDALEQQVDHTDIADGISSQLCFNMHFVKFLKSLCISLHSVSSNQLQQTLFTQTI